jgi:hypothetical protein
VLCVSALPQWVVRVTFQDGAKLYYAGRMNERMWSSVRGDALRYDSQDEAISRASGLKQDNSRISEVEVEEIKNPRKRY